MLTGLKVNICNWTHILLVILVLEKGVWEPSYNYTNPIFVCKMENSRYTITLGRATIKGTVQCYLQVIKYKKKCFNIVILKSLIVYVGGNAVRERYKEPKWNMFPVENCSERCLHRCIPRIAALIFRPTSSGGQWDGLPLTHNLLRTGTAALLIWRVGSTVVSAVVSTCCACPWCEDGGLWTPCFVGQMCCDTALPLRFPKGGKKWPSAL